MADKLIVRVSLNPRNIFESRIIEYLSSQENMAGALKQLAYERLMIDQLQVGRTPQSISLDGAVSKTRPLRKEQKKVTPAATPTPETPASPPEVSQPTVVADSIAGAIPTLASTPENDAERTIDNKLDKILGSFL